MGNDPALAMVRWHSERNRGLDPLVATRGLAIVLRERVDFPTMNGGFTITCGIPGNGEL
jgi:hypothetical protein